MTTTISRHDMQLQLQQQQQQQQQQLLQQQLQQQQPQPQRTSFLLRNTANSSNSLANNAVNNFNNTTKTTTTTIYPYQFNSTLTPTLATTITNTTTTTTTICLDSATAIIQIDSLNNNNNNNSNSKNSNNNTSLSATTTTTPTATQSGLNNINNNSSASPDAELPPSVAAAQPKAQKRRSLLNFKSLDYHIKSLYSGLRNGNKQPQPQSQSQCSSPGSGNANGSGFIANGTPTTAVRTPAVHNRMPPYLKIEAVDTEESENLLLDYPQSPYSSRRNSSHDDNRSSSQLLHINRYEMSRSPSPYYLSPYAMGSGNIRRSSTSDIVSCKRSGTSSASDSRRPSTTDLLRRARERRSCEARMGRSVSHGGLPRGGLGMGGRRKSMA